MGALCNPKACLSNVASIYRGYLARGVVRFSSIMWQKALFCVFPKLACGEAISSVNPFMSIDLAARILRAYKNWRTKHVLSGLEPKIIRLEKLGNISTNKKKGTSRRIPKWLPYLDLKPACAFRIFHLMSRATCLRCFYAEICEREIFVPFFSREGSMASALA